MLAACQPVPTPPLKVGMNPWVGYDPLVLARDKGLLDTTLVKVVELSSSSESLRHFRNGLLDGAALTLDEALRLADEGMDVRIVGVLSASAGADVVVARSDIRSPAQLRGRRLAVEKTTVGALMLQRLLKAGGLQPQEVVVQNMEASQHLAALRTERVDAAVTFEPLAGAMRAAGFSAIFDSRQMPGDIVDVLVVQARVLDRHPEQVEALALGWQRGLEAMQREPQLAAQVLAVGADLTPADYLATLQGLRFYSAEERQALLSGRPRVLGQQSEGLALTLQLMGLIKETPDWGRLLDEDWAQRLRGLQERQP
ncbi:ABC transporter substrate-binding protein [Hydrogenophaga sp. MI9]|uniref:ABC transporter substrate-binding protein n=1 Tax=Hydrogenophaga sp. MI9 TaxID=3453719 RepID=UPI003EF046BB